MAPYGPACEGVPLDKGEQGQARQVPWAVRGVVKVSRRLPRHEGRKGVAVRLGQIRRLKDGNSAALTIYAKIDNKGRAEGRPTPLGRRSQHRRSRGMSFNGG